MMTLDEAIEHAKDKAQELYNTYAICGWSDEGSCDGKSDCRVLKHGKDKGCLKCCEEHDQLASWLEELRGKKGYWRKIKMTEPGALGIRYQELQCSVCGWTHSLIIPRSFCPNCGADMREKE